MRPNPPSSASCGGTITVTLFSQEETKMSMRYKLRKGRLVKIPDPLETNSNKRKRVCKKKEEDEDVGTSLSGICTVKTRQEMKIIEEKEDCFILDFDPNESFDVEKLSSTSDNPDGDDDVEIIHEKGEV